MNSINLKTRILAPLTLSSIAILLVFISIINKEEKSHIHDEIEKTLQAAQNIYQNGINEHAQKLLSTLDVLTNDATILDTLEPFNREKLLSVSQPLFHRLKSKYNITHFYYHNIDRTNLLRVHQPWRHGDIINRHTTIDAEQTGEAIYGVELGPLGTFTLRAVMPVRKNGKLLGYMELGEEIDSLINKIHTAFDIDLIITIEKIHLKRNEWEAGMRMLGRNSDWDRLDDSVIVSSTLLKSTSVVSEILNRKINNNIIEINWNEQNHWASFIDLKDAGKKIVGKMITLRDMTDRKNSSYMMIFIISSTAIATSIILFIAFYWLLGRTEKYIEKTQQGLKENQKRLTHAQQMAHIGNWQWNITDDTVNLSSEACRILGIRHDNQNIPFSNILNLIHDNDKENFQKFIDKVRSDGKLYNYTHKIIQPGGLERIVEHRSEVVINEEGNPTIINSIIHDITEIHEAGIISARMGRIFENAWDEIFTFDSRSLKFIQVSNGACKNLGYNLAELKNLTPFDIMPEINSTEFKRRLEVLITGARSRITFESKHQRKDKTEYPVEVRLQLSSIESPPVYIAIVQDISEREHYIAELEHQAMYDTLTNLPNRFLLQDQIKTLINQAESSNQLLSVFIVDMIRLKEINDILGHHNGDIAINKIAKRLQENIGDSVTVSRFAGNEFAVVQLHNNQKQILDIANKIQEIFSNPVTIEDISLEIEAAIGVAIYPEHGENASTLLQHADIAMRESKKDASHFCIYNPETDVLNLRHLRLLGELRTTIANKNITVYYQPKLDIKNGTIVGAEALARWEHPAEGMIQPNDFIPMVEQSGLIRPFTLLMIEKTIQQCKKWLDNGINLKISVNLSTRNLLEPDLPDNIKSLLTTYNLDAKYLILEITESAVMTQPENSLRVLTQLHEIGLKLSIDDFGTGYSSLSYLKRLPVNELKIDYSFVSSMSNDDNDAVIVRSIIDLAHNLGLTVVAEGVENQETLDILEILRCNQAQGYHLSKPISAEEFEQWLKLNYSK
ncbi:MAG: EAL domain-containing protein [Gammaproteobacteria bacterium]|nr:EAL domain-containing protein [Gammaproteobacteria bacterium]